MKTLPQVLEDYLTLRRAMGFKLSEAGTLLPQFVAYLAQRGHTFITLSAFAGNARARGLYEHLGYEPETLHYRKAL